MKKHALASLLLGSIILLSAVVNVRATNLVTNGSFELLTGGALPFWSVDGGLAVGFNVSSAEGTNHVLVGSQTPGSISQEIRTQPGETYYLRISTRQKVPSLFFGGEPVPLDMPSPLPPLLLWFDLGNFVTATGSVTRIEIRDGYVDDVQLISILDPVEIQQQPEGRTVLEGGTVAFTVRALGGPPLRYAWLLNGVPLPDGTNATLILTNVTGTNAGVYSVVVSNTFSTVTSSDAALAVELPPEVPLIVSQPTGDIIPVGYAYTLSVVALGTPPLRYQWFLGGAEMPGETNRTIRFSSLQSSNAGTYLVRVENESGSVSSLPATVVPTNTVGSGYINHQNFTPGVRQPIYDLDGTTRLSGSNYFAQLYAGASPTLMRALGFRRPFGIGSLAGFFLGGNMLMPDVPPHTTVYVQTRVWEAAAGVSYEDARARGGRFGSSPVFTMMTVEPVQVPPYVPMISFSLKAGLPLFTTGRLEVNSVPTEGPIEWKLTGVVGARYLVEKRHPPADWVPLLLLTNQTGTVLFTDTNAASESINFYRARILD